MPASISGTKVLLVEDRGDVQAIATMMLTRLGCSVVSVATAEAAIEILDDQHASIEVVFTDIHLPGNLTGYDLAKQVTARWPTVRIVITSGSANTAVIRGAARHEGYTVIGKPYRANDLLEAIRAELGRPSAS